MATLFEPIQAGPFTFTNRCALAAMTRERCAFDGVPTAMHAAYFAQRANAGLLVTGNTRISLNGACGPNGPGIHTQAHVDGWKLTTDAVHANGGHIFLQIMHSGAGGHPEVLPEGCGVPISPSGISWGGVSRTHRGKLPSVEPRIIEAHEIPALVDDYKRAAERAMAAGFDGVELHGCSGYLMDEFLCSGTNKRTDQYGGSVENRTRLLFEVLEGVLTVTGPGRAATKVSPEFNKNDIVVDDNPQELFGYIAERMSELKVTYWHVADNSFTFDYHAYLRPKYKGVYMAGVGFMPDRAKAYIAEGKADMISFGRTFISNPDLMDRIRTGAKLAPLDPSTIYSAGPRGLLDYPTLEVAAESSRPEAPVG